jgi:protein-S-isoprenylcysteine O-methyltransferase Ste14
LRGWLAISILVPVAAAVLVGHPSKPQDSFADVAVDFVAWLLYVLGGAFRFWATLFIGGRKNRILVVEGPYSLCRNPLYVGSFLLAASLSVFLRSVTLGAAIALVATLYARMTIPAEQQHLEKIFGEAYREYLRRVPRFIPSAAVFRTARSIEVDVKAIHREAKRASAWVALPFLVEVVTHLRHAPWWPSLVSLP